MTQGSGAEGLAEFNWMAFLHQPFLLCVLANSICGGLDVSMLEFSQLDLDVATAFLLVIAPEFGVFFVAVHTLADGCADGISSNFAQLL